MRILIDVDFPAPLGPMYASRSPGRHVEGERADRLDLAARGAATGREDLREPPHLDRHATGCRTDPTTDRRLAFVRLRSRQAEQQDDDTRIGEAGRPEEGRQDSEADEAAGAGAGGLAVLEGDLAGHEGGDVAVGALHEAAAAGRQVEHHLGRPQVHGVEVDQVEVGPLALGDHAAVGEAVGGRGARRSAG